MKKTEISQIQKQFWILHNLYPETTAYNIPNVYRIEGELDKEALENAVNAVIRRNEMLRTQFNEINNQVWQEVLQYEQTNFNIDGVSLNESFTSASSVKQIHEEVHKTFNLTTWPLFRIKLLSFRNDIIILSIVFHHIIIDLFSLQKFSSEISILYNQYSTGNSSSLRKSENNYFDYSIWLQKWLSSETANSKISKWEQAIPEIPEPVKLPSDYSRPRVENLKGNRKHFILDTVSSEDISRFSRDNSVIDFTVLLAAYAIFLHRISNQTKIIIGVPFANRKDKKFKQTFGCFINNLPVHFDFSEDPCVKDFLQQVSQSLLETHHRQEIPFLLLNRVLGQNDGTALFKSGFTFEPPIHLDFNKVKITPLIVERNGAQLELFFSLWDDGRNYHANIQYSNIFKTSSIEQFWSIYSEIVKSVIENSESHISEIPITPKKDLQLIYSFNNTDNKYENNICIHQKFEQQVEKTPDNPALVFNDQSVSYKELNDNDNRIANTLIEAGVIVEDVVGICIDRSIEMMVGIYGILKTGAAYLPLSPDNPTERLKSIIDDARPKLILSTRSSSVNLPEGSKLLFIDELLKNPLSNKISNPNVRVNSRNLAYIIYTSGSTGKPKGVMIEHHSVLNRLGWMQNAYPIDKNDCLLQKTPVTFDVSVWELFWWAFNGARLVLLPKGGEKDPETIVQYIHNYKVSVIHFVPSMFVAFFEMLKARQLFPGLKSLNRIFMSGEALPLNLVKEFNECRANHSLPGLINLYGPTEATVDVSYFNCPEDEINNVYIGKAIDNTKLFVTNDNNCIQPICIPGELIITGVNLARGYLNNQELTLQKFFDFNIPEQNIVRAYRTGDLVKLSEEGEIEFLGRIDKQVKIRGFRIELGDIESKILEHPMITNCAVIVADNIEPSSLAAYICSGSGAEIEEDIIRTYVSGKLPEYMVPSYFILLDSLPLTGSGKLDRKNLPKPDRYSVKDSVIDPSTKYEKRLLGLWKKLLIIETISINDNFFDIGGNSLLAINLATTISKEFNIIMNTLSVFEFPSIKDQGVFLSGTTKEEISSGSFELDEKTRRRRNVNYKKYR